MTQHLSIAVAIPSGEVWQAQFGLSLAQMCAYFGMSRVGKALSQKLHIISSRGSMLSQLRENLVLAARKCEASHILFLDSDMTFPKDIIHRLIAHDKDFVVCNATTKTIPADPVAVLLNGQKLYTDDDSKGLVEILQCGVAVGLLKTSIFDNIERPWFKMEWEPKINHFMGEDIYFCRKVREQKIKLYVDQDASQKVGHVGTFVYDHSITGSIVREEVA